ncbi:DUF4003 family protein [Mesobacillus zeae]|uniref:DUF4003 domain-containing protein n=1 Tax=Mesobacillus zeae TaxID=1917180 RepID=A0A398B3H2_9BACI|nr:DUF4003 family protein [Mesobacillus zeae]RID82500.1 DUF4003 domain-containing protein [Mesobacillus zeae]
MLEKTFEDKLQLYKEIYSELKSELKWKVSDQRILMMVALLYAMNKKPFEFQRFLRMSDYIKSNVGAFNTLKSEQRFTTAAMLDTRFDDPENKFQDLLGIYERLVGARFSRGASTYIAAQVLLAQQENSSSEDIQRIMEIYKGMKSHHMFLTSASDYPLAALLAGREGTVEEIIERVEHFYQKLSRDAFCKGNDLQFLSHILSIDEQTDADRLIQRCTSVYDAFKLSGKKPKGMHYPVVGLLALLEEGNKEVSTIMEGAAFLNGDKLFKWHKDLNIVMAANLMMSEKMENTSLLETGIYTTIDAIIQAQQAAMIAVMASTSAAAASSGGGE